MCWDVLRLPWRILSLPESRRGHLIPPSPSDVGSSDQAATDVARKWGERIWADLTRWCGTPPHPNGHRRHNTGDPPGLDYARRHRTVLRPKGVRQTVEPDGGRGGVGNSSPLMAYSIGGKDYAGCVNFRKTGNCPGWGNSGPCMPSKGPPQRMNHEEAGSFKQLFPKIDRCRTWNPEG